MRKNWQIDGNGLQKGRDPEKVYRYLLHFDVFPSAREQQKGVCTPFCNGLYFMNRNYRPRRHHSHRGHFRMHQSMLLVVALHFF